MDNEEHYLKQELYALISKDPRVFEFLENGSLDGVWYWDIENPKEEWLSPRFKTLFGYAEHEIPHTSDWWQANIHPDDLQLAIDNFNKHCEDPSHAYDQVVRYKHKDGSTVWVRCRGMAIRDGNGKAIRMLGTHMDVTQLRAAQLEAEQHYEYAPVMFLSFDIDGIIVKCNQELVTRTGYTREELIGMSRDEIYDPSCHARMEKLFSQFPEEDVVIAEDLAMRTKGGEIVPIEVKAWARRDASGNFLRTRSIWTDVSELRNAERRYHDVFNHAPDMMLSLDTDGTIQFCNDTLCRTLGFTREELIGRSALDLYHPTCHQAARDAISLWGSTGSVKNAELQVVAKDGRIFDVLLSASSVRDERGRVISSRSTWRDVTELRLAQEALEASESRLANLVSSIPDCVITANSEGVIEDANPAAAATFGREAESFPGMVINDLFPPEVVRSLDIDRRRTEGLDFLRGAVMHLDVLRSDGTEFRAGVTVNAFEGMDERKFLWIIRDISGELRHEQERRSLVRALEEKNDELESIIYAASHDLRSPLVNLHGFSDELRRTGKRVRELLSDVDLPPEKAAALNELLRTDMPEALGFIESSGRKMDQLIKGLLKLSRLGTSDMQLRRLDMNELISEVVRSTQYVLDEIDATVTIEELPPCLGDAGQVSQVFSNLIDNAIKYRRSERPCRIRISAKSKSRDSIYFVEDNGVGVAPNHRAKVFEVFHRLNPGNAVEGEGLGLAIVRRIVDRHDGTARLEESDSGGAKFVITLPAPRLTQIAKGVDRSFHAGV